MRYMFFYFVVVVFSLYSCSSEPTGHIDDLLTLDTVVRKYASLSQFTSFCVSVKRINDTAVCDSINEKCRPGERNYTIILDEIGIPVKAFDSLSHTLCRIGFKTYYRYGDYSIWVENGAFGDIYGYIISHNPLVSEVKSFELYKRYHIGIGKRVRKNVYYFSSNIN